MKLPIFFENSMVAALANRFSPISEVWAITLGPFIFCRGIMSGRTRLHETIHWKQYKELGIIGFLILYPLMYLRGLQKYGDRDVAYYMIPFEQEAYDNDNNPAYLDERKPYAWLKYKL